MLPRRRRALIPGHGAGRAFRESVTRRATRPRDLCPADGWNSGAAGWGWLTEVRERERDRNRLGFVNLDVSETRLGLSSSAADTAETGLDLNLDLWRDTTLLSPEVSLLMLSETLLFSSRLTSTLFLLRTCIRFLLCSAKADRDEAAAAEGAGLGLYLDLPLDLATESVLF